MIKGYVNEYREPVVSLSLLGAKEIGVVAVIDTGFNGFVSIPSKMIAKLAWQKFGQEIYELASGEDMKSDTFIGNVRFGNRRKQVLAVAGSPSEVLIGTRLMDGMELRIHFGAGSVTIR